MIIAVAGMQPGQFFKADVKGLTNGTDSTVLGVVYFAESRCMKGNKDTPATNGWNDYFITVLAEDVKKFLDFHNMLDSEGEQLPANVTIDGEACVNGELMDPRVFELLN